MIKQEGRLSPRQHIYILICFKYIASLSFRLLLEQTERRPSNPYEIRWRENIEEHYNICGELGRGRFSIVKRCVEKSTGREFAAKIVRRRMRPKEVVECEVAILQTLKHQSIVTVHEIYDAPKGLVIVEQL